MSQVFPAHWDILPFSLAVKDATSEYSKLQKSEYLEQGRFPIVDQGQQKFGGYTDDDSVVSLDGCPAIVFGDHTRIFKFIDEPFCLGADGAKVLEPKAELDKKFLYYYLSSLNIESAGYSRHFKFLKENVVPVPPLPEQKRIAVILDKADAIRRKRQQAIQLADDFLRAVFLDMFGDPVTNPKGWETKALRDISRIQIGPFGTQLHKEDYVEGGVPLVNPTHIIKGQIVPKNDLTISKEKHAELPEYHLNTGDIIMGRRGEMGRCAVITEKESGWLCGTGSLFLRPEKVGIFSEYLSKFLSSDAIKNHLESESQGATMPNLNKTIVGSIQVPVPSELALERFARIKEKTLGAKVMYSKFSEEIIFDAISQKAFSGKL